MNKQQLGLVAAGIACLLLLFFFGNTIPPAQKPAMPAPASAPAVTAESIIARAKSTLDSRQAVKLAGLENSVTRGDVHSQQVDAFQALAGYWGDSLGHPELGLYYLGEAAKLENSEKKLNFAARLTLDRLMEENDPALQAWLGHNARSLFEQSLRLNPANDSTRVGLGACYLFGNISDNPMEGILEIRKVAEAHPDNLYAQMMLGLGDVRSGQYEKAAERFRIVAEKQPDNLEAILHLAEVYERTGKKNEAVEWYRRAADMVQVPSVKKEIENRIHDLKEH